MAEEIENTTEEVTEETTKETIARLEAEIKKMEDDRDAKCDAAKEQLVNKIRVTVDQYYTATGIAESLRVLRFTMGEENATITDSLKLAKMMAELTDAMAVKAESLLPANMEELCVDFYDGELANRESLSAFDLAYEMMKIDLCRNVGPAAEDMVAFINRVEEEIENVRKSIKDLEEE